MHSYASIEEFARFDTVTFYTLRGEENVLSETDDFFERMGKEEFYKRQRNRLVQWIVEIGNDKWGANFELFRPERICVALPPKGKYLDENIDLRLYCHWVSKNVVILFNGGIKTANFAQDCPNVSYHFYNAQGWTKQLIEIGIETDGPAITNIEELYLKY
ncbi:MAG TPA: hypothetical protein VNS58_20020 [Puia sp.]|nr:hypothetical protein [Puia sp.]